MSTLSEFTKRTGIVEPWASKIQADAQHAAWHTPQGAAFANDEEVEEPEVEDTEVVEPGVVDPEVESGDDDLTGGEVEATEE